MKKGRPTGTSKSDTRSVRISIRAHPKEKLAIERRAASHGTSVSEYLLTKGLEGKE